MTEYGMAMTGTTVALAGVVLFLSMRVERFRKTRDHARRAELTLRSRLNDIDRAHSAAVAAGSLARTLHLSARHLETLAENTEDPEERQAAQVYLHAICAARRWAMRDGPPEPESDSNLPE